ncbi:MAG: energy-coupling factor transporter ATPase [Mycoplasmoidaceae bacterium]
MTEKNVNKIIQFKNITFGYNPNVIVLDDLTFDILENEYVCIIGHNGSGKSTISKILTSLLKPSSGEMYVMGNLINESNINMISNNIGIVFQNPDNQFIGITAEDDIAFGLENRKVPQEEMKDIIVKAAKKVDVEHLLRMESQILSGGEKQRVAIASILAIDPGIIIFDEATSMLDPKGKNELKKLMIELRDKGKKTVISITHDMEEVINADRVIVLSNGKIVSQGIPSVIFSDEKELQKIKLDFPFTLKIACGLNKFDAKIKRTLNKEELVANICQTIK